MRSIKVALATGAVLATTIGGAYAAGVVNRNGHEVDGHAAAGQAVAARARADHGASPNASEDAATKPNGSTSASEPTDPSPGPTATGEHGHRYGQVKSHRHYGHQWGRGHGSGAVVKPDNPNKPDGAQHGHGMNASR